MMHYIYRVGFEDRDAPSTDSMEGIMLSVGGLLRRSESCLQRSSMERVKPEPDVYRWSVLYKAKLFRPYPFRVQVDYRSQTLSRPRCPDIFSEHLQLMLIVNRPLIIVNLIVNVLCEAARVTDRNTNPITYRDATEPEMKRILHLLIAARREIVTT